MKWHHTLRRPLFAKQLGLEAERLTTYYLKKRGLQLITQNFHSRFGELDIIMRDKDTLAFIEVKARQALNHTPALESITSHKIARLKKTANFFIICNKQYQHCACRFDVVAITNRGMILDFLWLKNAFS